MAPKSVCKARMKYLEQQAQSFKNWLSTVNPEHSETIVERIERETWNLLRKDTDDEFIWSRSEVYDRDGQVDEENDIQETLFDTAYGKDDVFKRLDEEKYMHIAYYMNMEETARKAFQNERDEVSHIEETWIKWLEKVDTIYHLNNQYLPKEIWKKCVQARTSIFRQRKARLINYTTFAMLSNWTNRLAGSPKRYEVPDLPEEENFTDADIELVYYTRS